MGQYRKLPRASDRLQNTHSGNMSLSDLFSLIAVILSAVSLWQARNAHKAQRLFSDTEIELIRRQLERDSQAQRIEKTANVSAKLVKEGNNHWKLRVLNQGPAVAKNVNVEIPTPKNSMLSKEWLTEKLPMTSMEKDDSVEIVALPDSETAPKETIFLTWEDPSSRHRRREVEITI